MLLTVIINNDSKKLNVNKYTYEYISRAITALLRYKTTIKLTHNKYSKEVTNGTDLITIKIQMT